MPFPNGPFQTAGAYHKAPTISIVVPDQKDDRGFTKTADRMIIAINKLTSPEGRADLMLKISVIMAEIIYNAVVAECQREIYDGETTPSFRSLFETRAGGLSKRQRTYGDNFSERAGALIEAHEIIMLNFGEFIVRVNPDYPVMDQHSGRDNVGSYAGHVHDGYEQWYMGTNTGILHPGRPWFERGVIASYPRAMSKAADFAKDEVAAILFGRRAQARIARGFGRGTTGMGALQRSGIAEVPS